MAWTGTATIVATGKDICRLTGLTLAATQAGTITEDGGGGGETLPAGFTFDSEAATIVEVVQAAAGAVEPLIVAKSGTPFDTVTITNQDGANATGALDIYIRKGISRTA